MEIHFVQNQLSLQINSVCACVPVKGSSEGAASYIHHTYIIHMHRLDQIRLDQIRSECLSKAAARARRHTYIIYMHRLDQIRLDQIRSEYLSKAAARARRDIRRTIFVMICLFLCSSAVCVCHEPRLFAAAYARVQIDICMNMYV